MEQDAELEQKLEAVHEAGQGVFAHLLDLPVKYITINKPARCRLTLPGQLITFIFKDLGCVFYTAGTDVQKYYYPHELPISEVDQPWINFMGGWLPSRKLKTEAYLRKQLADPKIRGQIEKLSGELLKRSTLSGTEIKAILETP
jgi:hypothetical protein